MSDRGRSPSPRPLKPALTGSDVDMAVEPPQNGTADGGSRVIVIQNLSRNVLEVHLRGIFTHYGTIKKVDFPTYRKSESLRS